MLDHEKAVACAAWVGNEIVKIVRARNIVLEDLVPGWSYYSVAFEDKAGLERAKQWLRVLQTPPPAEGEHAPGYGEGHPVRD